MKEKRAVDHFEGLPRPKGVTTLASVWTGDSSDERDLVARAQSGDAKALRAICEAQLPRVERLLGRILGPRRDFEDLVQNVFLELCKALPGFQGNSKLSTFVGGITVRVARRALRPTAYDRRRGPMPHEVAVADDGPERSAIATERLRRLHAALDRVGSKKRIAFALWALDGMSPAEIAELTGAKLHTVRSRIYHARQELMADPAVRELMGEP
ncbi:MAG: sigma-70 family RNA polymerase sigma factor [Sandaracinaceae bacterium]|nr:sigma-70 family RNA polymerase sigma factor [Sandaracinaceae bacterium]